ncbi:MAG TPA: class I SAM-dependent methyltransferase [Actinospica sp.]|jgi:SAM-dependent methyltransferase|nr:class I SAM-dependent methyltransferase [Actinospica sp.]
MNRGTGPGEITPDGCAVELYARLPASGEPEIVHAAVPEGSDVLELGCGTGRIATPLAALGHRVVGVDESAEMLARCRGIETVRSSIQDLELAERFDAVLLPSHIINADAGARTIFLRVCHRHLAPGGVVVVQRHRPGWVRTVTDTVHDSGTMRSGITVLGRPAPDQVRARVRYEVGDSVWEQEFTATDLDDETLPGALAAAGLRLDRILTRDGGWFTARSASD